MKSVNIPCECKLSFVFYRGYTWIHKKMTKKWKTTNEGKSEEEVKTKSMDNRAINLERPIDTADVNILINLNVLLLKSIQSEW